MNVGRVSKTLALAVCGFLVFQLAACGTIIYPERRGQTSGEIDPAIALLDGIGLLFFIVPGLVAFAIDFSTGAIYMPAGSTAQDRVDQLREGLNGQVETRKDNVIVRFEPEEMSQEKIESILTLLSGAPVDIDQAGVRAYRYSDRSELPEALAALVRESRWPALAAL